MSNASPTILPPREPRGISRLIPFEKQSLRTTIAQSGLSDEAQEIVRTVIRKSRLWRFEKIEVAHELISHFQDGELSGKNHSQLIANFGDPHITAKLIRRSKIRNRPIMMKIAQISGWFFLAVASAYLAIYGYFHAGTPVPTKDFHGEMNLALDDVDESDLAWPIYRPAWTKHKFCEGGGFNSQQLFLRTDGQRMVRSLKPTDPQWNEAVARLGELQDLLQSFRDGAKRPRLGLQLQANPKNYSNEDFACLYPHLSSQDTSNVEQWFETGGMRQEVKKLLDNSIIGITLPHIQSFRSAARILVVDTRRAIEQEQPARVVENINTIFGLAGHASDGNILVGSLVAFATAGISFDLIEEVLTEHPGFLSDDELSAIQDDVEKLNIRSWMRLGGERALMYDLAQRIFTDDGNGDGRITPIGLEVLGYLSGSRAKRWSDSYPEFPAVMSIAQDMAEPAALFVVASRRETMEIYDTYVDQLESDLQLSFWEAEHQDFDTFIENQSWRYLVLDKMLPANLSVRFAMDRTIARQETAIAALASHRYQLLKGEWPDSIEQLAPDFVVELPVDIVDGSYLKLKSDGQRLVIYSVGNDREDDGGTPPVAVYEDVDNKRRTRHVFNNRQFVLNPDPNNKSSDGDWILWPHLEEQDD